ncbi:MAG TPA: proline dehydrogenase family protein [Ktedonobacterales bacterium]|jgi:proline dehydrogenase
MLKETMLYLARQETIKDFMTHNPAGRRVARRFVAGETLDEAIEATRRLNARGISVSLDHLGENVSDEAEARATADAYIAILDRIQAESVEANISIKLTALGLDIGSDLCRANVDRVLTRARDGRIFVRVDMEGSDYTERTLDMVFDLRRTFDNVGTVVQTCLHRTPRDVEALIGSHTRVRLVKGAYLEPSEIAYARKADVDEQYVILMRELLARGNYPAIATHDEAIIAEARRFAADHAIPHARFEFQMLYGIRRDLQERLAGQGYNVRAYVPYGTQWYPYLTRRMAERPANLIFIMSNTLRG